MELRRLDSENLKDFLPLMSDGLESLEKNAYYFDRSGTLIECVKGDSMMLVWLDDMAYKGFFVLRGFSDNLYIQHFFGKEKIVDVEWDWIIDQLKALARRCKYKYLRFMSKRRGWKKLAPRLGFKEELIQYNMEVT
jgi:hypothetical protein